METIIGAGVLGGMIIIALAGFVEALKDIAKAIRELEDTIAVVHKLDVGRDE